MRKSPPSRRTETSRPRQASAIVGAPGPAKTADRRRLRETPAPSTTRTGPPNPRGGRRERRARRLRRGAAGRRAGRARRVPCRGRRRARAPAGHEPRRGRGEHDAKRLTSRPGREVVAHGERGIIDRTVPAPTSTASLSARRRWTSRRASAPVIHRLEPSGAAVLPSSVAASLSTTKGRPVDRCTRYGRSWSLTAPASTPPETVTPAASSARNPAPATLRPGR